MSHAPGGGSPNAGSHPGGRPPRTATSPTWWVVAGLAVLVSVALVVWLLVTSGGGGAVPTAPITTTQDPTAPVSGTTAPVSPDGGDWGAMPPQNLDALKDLSKSTFPATLGPYTFQKEDRTADAAIGDYENVDTYATLSAVLDFDTPSYRITVESLFDAAYVGPAVCGAREKDGTAPLCVMAGRNETLSVSTADEGATVDELAATIEELYDAL